MQINKIELQPHGDDRGQLVVIENHHEIPFEVKRVFFIYDTEDGVRRGFHCLRTTKQALICVSGTCKIALDDGQEKAIVPLDNPYEMLVIEPELWREMFDFSDGAVLLVLASEPYDESDYIRNYDDFIAQKSTAVSNSDANNSSNKQKGLA